MIAGPLTETEAELFDRDVSPARIVRAGSVSRERALALQRAADALLLIAQPTRSQLLNIKLFEYLASGTPILALAAGTDAGRVVGGGRRRDGARRRPGGDRRRARDASPAASCARRERSGRRAYTYPAPAERMAAAVEAAVASSAG